MLNGSLWCGFFSGEVLLGQTVHWALHSFEWLERIVCGGGGGGLHGAALHGGHDHFCCCLLSNTVKGVHFRDIIFFARGVINVNCCWCCGTRQSGGRIVVVMGISIVMWDLGLGGG